MSKVVSKVALMAVASALFVQIEAIGAKEKSLRENVVSSLDLSPETNALRASHADLVSLANSLPDEEAAPAAVNAAPDSNVTAGNAVPSESAPVDGAGEPVYTDDVETVAVPSEALAIEETPAENGDSA